MSVITYLDLNKELSNNDKKTLSFSSNLAKSLNANHILVSNTNNETYINSVFEFGVDKAVIGSEIKYGSKSIGGFIVDVAKNENANYIVFANDYNGKWFSPYVSSKLNYGIVSGVGSKVKINENKGNVSKEVFAGKAICDIEIKDNKGILLVVSSNFEIEENKKTPNIEKYSSDSKPSPTLKEIQTIGGDSIPLPDAEKVVSAGRGLKGPENWEMIETLAKKIGAATACSRPVSDSGWRPHHEHVGQTGVAIRPNLYFAIGISGAIQHLAGVSGSKVKVVINNDPEAPFFKAGDYGIVGDAFEIVPELIEKL